jgi:hypothetical protein
MSGRILLLILLLAALSTATTYLQTAETKEIRSEAGLRDLERMITVHGWPWGYYADVIELVRYSEHRVAVIEFTEFYFEKLGQTFLVWFVAWLVVVPLLLLAISPRQRPV